MDTGITAALDEYVDAVRGIYGDHLRAVILFGSYARGDYDADSDIDIMLLLDESPSRLRRLNRELTACTADLNTRRGVYIVPIKEQESVFRRLGDAYPFFMGVRADGRELYATGA